MLAQAIALVALALLAASGATKIAAPSPTSGALEAARLPHSPFLVRALGLLEVGAAAIALALGGPWVIPALVLYAAFSLFVAAALRGDISLQSCGCFGREDTPPSLLHLFYNLSATGALLFVVLAHPTLLLTQVGIAGGTVLVALAGTGAYLSYLILSELPKTLALIRR